MKKQILVLNDRPATREAIQFILEEAGYGCVQAETDQHALEALCTEHIDLITQDMVRPLHGNLAGAKFIRLLRAERLLGDTPIVILSAHRKETVKALFDEEGIRFDETVAGYVMLPADPGEIVATLESAFVSQELLRMHRRRKARPS